MNSQFSSRLLISFIATLLFSACTKKQGAVSDPVITSIVPESARGGDTVTINGTNLPVDFSSVRIAINDKEVTVLNATAERIQAKVPELSGSGKIEINMNGSVYEGPAFTYQYQAIVTTIAGDGSVGASDGNGISASFNCPWGIAADKNDNLLIADCYNRLIRKIAAPDYSVSTFSIPVTLPGGNFYSPYNLAIDNASGNVYVTDFNDHLMRMKSSGEMDVIYTATQPLAGIAVSPDGKNLYVGNNTAGTITKLNIDGTNAAEFTSGLITPRNIIFDREGKMYVAAYPGPIYEISTSGTPTVVGGPADFGGWEVVKDSSGNFFLADHFKNCLYMVEKNGNSFIIAGSGDPKDEDGIGLKASFNGPQGLTIDSKGSLFLTTYNYDTKEGNKVRKIVIK